MYKNLPESNAMEYGIIVLVSALHQYLSGIVAGHANHRRQTFITLYAGHFSQLTSND